MDRDCDVLVLGGGVAGAAAALGAAQQGARVVLVRTAPGTTAASLGVWRGQPPAALRDALARAGLPLHELSAPLPRPDGTLQHGALAPLSHVRASLDTAATLVCGIHGLPGFHAAALAALWADAAGRSQPLAATTLTLADSPAAGWSPVALAALLEREPARLTTPLARLIADTRAERVILPAVLGLERHAHVLDAITTQTGALLGEALGAAPSVPGWRLDVALRSALAAAAVDVMVGRAHTQQQRHITAVSIVADDVVHTVRASSYVLATGKFIGGGIAAEPHFREPALGCTVVAQRYGRSFDSAVESLLLTSDTRQESQPLLEAGVMCDDAAQPLDHTGVQLFDNVFVAGSVRAGVATAALGLGDAATDGWHAGLRAAEAARAAGGH